MLQATIASFDRSLAKINVLSKEWNPEAYNGPAFLTWKDADGRTHVEVEQLSDTVLWSITENKMVKIYDSEEKPF